MLRLIINRLFLALPLLIVVSIFIFAIARIIPGDPAIVIAGEDASAETIERIRQEIGLDRPMPLQYLEWLRAAIGGDFGKSLYNGEDVLGAILARLPITLYVVFVGLAIALVLGTVCGVASAFLDDRWFGRAIASGAVFVLSIPNFVICLLLILLFSLNLGWFSATGFRHPGDDLWESLRTIALPAATLGLAGAAELTMHTRSAVRASLEAEYTSALRSRQIPLASILFRHALRNAGIPLITVVALVFQHLLGAVVVLEVLCAIPGIGSLSVAAVQTRDITMLQGIVVCLAIVVLAVNLLTDVLYIVIDPRTRKA